jgi:hypothetical protein
MTTMSTRSAMMPPTPKLGHVNVGVDITDLFVLSSPSNRLRLTTK